MADLSVTAASVVNVSAQTNYGTAGETITAGQAIYLKSADNKLWKAQCDGTAEEGAPIGIALSGGAVGQPIFYATKGAIVIGATTIKTTTYVLSAAAGGICPQADLVSTNRIARVGHATDTAGSFFVDIYAVGAVV